MIYLNTLYKTGRQRTKMLRSADCCEQQVAGSRRLPNSIRNGNEAIGYLLHLLAGPCYPGSGIKGRL